MSQPFVLNKVSCICSFSSANKCLLKVALYAAQIEQYEKAAEIYEKVGLVEVITYFNL